MADIPQLTRKQHTKSIFSTRLPDGGYLIENTETGERFTSRDVKSLAAYIRGHSKKESHYPIGTMIHEALKRVGVEGCLPCAERQALLDSMVPRFTKPKKR